MLKKKVTFITHELFKIKIIKYYIIKVEARKNWKKLKIQNQFYLLKEKKN